MSRLLQPMRFGAWRLDGHPQVIEYATHIVRQIHAETMRSFRMFAHGGLAVGGVLFGQGDRHLVRILAWRPFACDYSLGPTFTLSESDQVRFADFLSACREDGELAGMSPVGWFRSHTRGRLQLDPSDIELHRRHFPKEWQLALILEPGNEKPTAAHLFIQPHLQPEPLRPALYVKDVLPGVRHDEPDDNAGSTAQPIEDEDKVREPASLPPSGDPIGKAESDSEFSEEAPAVEAQEEDVAAIQFPPAPRGRLPWIVAPLIVLLVLAAAGWAFHRWIIPPEYWQAVRQSGGAVWRYLGSARDYWTETLAPRSVPPISLRAVLSGSGLLIRWDASSRVLRGVQGGRLRITDGASIQDRELDMAEVSQGAYTYAPLTRDVSVRLTLLRGGEPPIVEATRYLGTAAERRPPADSRRPEELEAEIERLRTAVLRQREQNETLEASLQTLSAVASAKPPEPASPPDPAPPLPEQPILAQKTPAGLSSSPPSSQTSPAPATASAPAAPPAGIKPAQGMLVWTGFLPGGQTLAIDGGRPSSGNLSGKLPGAPARINVWPGDLTRGGLVAYTDDSRYTGGPVVEEPSPRNSWTRTTFLYDPARAGEITVLEPPAEQNGWNQIVLAASGRPLRVVVIRWSKAAP